MPNRHCNPFVASTNALLAVCLSFLGGCGDAELLDRARPGLIASPTAVDFPPVFLGRTRSTEVVLENPGPVPVDIAGIEVRHGAGPATVSVVSPPQRLGAGEVVALRLRATASTSSTGAFLGEVEIRVGAGEPVSLSYTGSVRNGPDCDDGNPCTLDTLDDELGCVHAALDDGQLCDDENVCTTDTRCVAGQCVGEMLSCDDGVACTIDRCEPDVGCVAEAADVRCDDDDPCTDDVCSAETGCANPPRPAGSICASDGCAAVGICLVDGSCATSAVPDGMPCDDGDPCTLDDKCQAGACVAGESVELAPQDPVVMSAGQPADLCGGVDAPWDCYFWSSLSRPEEILDAFVHPDGRARVVWRGPFIDSFAGEPCDPKTFMPLISAARARPVPVDVPEDGDGVAESPGTGIAHVCAAPVFRTDFGVGGAYASDAQLTAVQGPVAASIRDATLGEWDPEVAVAYGSRDRAAVYVEVFGGYAAPIAQYTLYRSWEDVDVTQALGALSVGLLPDGSAWVAGLSQTRPFGCTDAEPSPCGIPLELWFASSDDLYTSAPSVVTLPQAYDASCQSLGGTSLPLVVEDMRIVDVGSDDSAVLSFRLDPRPCADVDGTRNPRLYRVPVSHSMSMSAMPAALPPDVGRLYDYEERGGTAAILSDTEGCSGPQLCDDADGLCADPVTVPCGGPSLLLADVDPESGDITTGELLSEGSPGVVAVAPLVAGASRKLVAAGEGFLHLVTAPAYGVEAVSSSTAPLPGYRWRGETLRGGQSGAALLIESSGCPCAAAVGADCDCAPIDYGDDTALVLQRYLCAPEPPPPPSWCHHDGDCGTGSVCDLAQCAALPEDPDVDVDCFGQCVAAPTGVAQGGQCELTSDCEAGLVCNMEAMVCLDCEECGCYGVCTAPSDGD